MDLSTTDRSRSRPEDRRHRPHLLERDATVVLVAALLALAAVAALLPSTRRIPALVLTNDSDYGLSIEVHGHGDDAWTPLPAVPRGASVRAADVLDHGDTWTFRVSGQGVPAGEFSRRRAELADAGWQVVVPQEVTRSLAEAGVPPSTTT
jgi:hypothetical protein